LHHFIKEPILIGYSGGDNARRLETYSDKAVIDIIMRDFKKLFGHDIPAPTDYVNTRWSHNPFSYGSYSYLKTGSSPTDYDVMAQSVSDRLFFAGEATSSKYPATTHGAYLSGIREAKKIKDIFRSGLGQEKTI
jgi:monoamine oxidase